MENPLPQRKKPRLEGYDYSQAGMYFVTICTHQRYHHFGHIVDGEMQLNAPGKIASEEIEKINTFWDNVDVDSFVVMPNHIHIIILISEQSVGTAFLPSEKLLNDIQKHAPTLGHIIGSYKAGVTRRIRLELSQPHLTVWQNSYHDHIIRHEKSLNEIREYVRKNPTLWDKDKFYGEE